MEHTLKANARDIVGKKVKRLRKDGAIPAVLYGRGVPSISLALDVRTFSKLYQEAGSSTIVSLHVAEAKPVKVLIKEPQLDPTSLKPIHVDLLQVNMKEKIRTEIPLEFVGESPAVVDLEGKLVHSLDAIEIECLPDDLVQHLDVDISGLTEFDQAIHVKDVSIPAGIEVLTDPELTILVVQAPLTEAELEAELAVDETTEEEAVAAVEGVADATEATDGEEIAETKPEAEPTKQ